MMSLSKTRGRRLRFAGVQRYFSKADVDLRPQKPYAPQQGTVAGTFSWIESK